MIDRYCQLVALRAIYDACPVEHRRLIEPFIENEIRHIKAIRRIEFAERMGRLIIILICLTTLVIYFL